MLTGNGTTAQGGGLSNEGTAYLTDSALENNSAQLGGGFSNIGDLSFLGTFVIDGNTSTGAGGGARNDGTLSLDNTNPPAPPAPASGGGSISGNGSGTKGGGLYNTFIVSLQNVVLDGNTVNAPIRTVEHRIGK